MSEDHIPDATKMVQPLGLASTAGLGPLPEPGDAIRAELPDEVAVRRVQLWAAELVAAERERCLEMVADEQVYPNDPDCAVLNPAIHRAMRRIENGMTLDNLRRETQRPNGSGEPA